MTKDIINESKVFFNSFSWKTLLNQQGRRILGNLFQSGLEHSIPIAVQYIKNMGIIEIDKKEHLELCWKEKSNIIKK